MEVATTLAFSSRTDSLTTQALMNEALISLTTTTNFKSIMISYIATGFFKDFSVYLIESIVF